MADERGLSRQDKDQISREAIEPITQAIELPDDENIKSLYAKEAELLTQVGSAIAWYHVGELWKNSAMVNLAQEMSKANHTQKQSWRSESWHLSPAETKIHGSEQQLSQYIGTEKNLRHVSPEVKNKLTAISNEIADAKLKITLIELKGSFAEKALDIRLAAIDSSAEAEVIKQDVIEKYKAGADFDTMVQEANPAELQSPGSPRAAMLPTETIKR